MAGGGKVFKKIIKVFIVFILIVVILIIIAIVSLIKTGFQVSSQKISNQTASNDLIENLQTKIERKDAPFLGAENAPIVITIFSDFQCQFSKEAFFVLREISRLYSDKAKFIYRDYFNSQLHPLALDSALAGRCAFEQNKFWPMYDKIFLNQENLSLENIKIFASQIGLNINQFNACFDSKIYKKDINQDLSEGVELGVNGTPTWFINGQKLEGNLPVDKFKELLDKLVNQ